MSSKKRLDPLEKLAADLINQLEKIGAVPMPGGGAPAGAPGPGGPPPDMGGMMGGGMGLPLLLGAPPGPGMPGPGMPGPGGLPPGGPPMDMGMGGPPPGGSGGASGGFSEPPPPMPSELPEQGSKPSDQETGNQGQSLEKVLDRLVTVLERIEDKLDKLEGKTSEEPEIKPEKETPTPSAVSGGGQKTAGYSAERLYKELLRLLEE